MPIILNKRIIAESLADNRDLTIMKAEDVVDDIFEQIRKGVKSGAKVSIGGFGIFRKKIRVARRCRDPRTGAEVEVAAMNIVRFSPATSFKELIK